MNLRILGALVATTTLVSTSPLIAADTDRDGLDDSVETGTGTYVSPSNTGTKPDDPDSDGDGAGDWYEVAIIDAEPGVGSPPNSPNDPDDKPNIPYPLPAPDGSSGTTGPGAPPVKVYILSGQSNMQGHGHLSPAGKSGTLETITKNEYKFPNLLNRSTWRVRNDVIYRGVISSNSKNGPLQPGQGVQTDRIGPELGFGHVMGYFHDEPVLIIKTSQGGRALGWDFLPPGSVRYEYNGYTYAGYGDSPDRWNVPRPTRTEFYGGYQFDQCFLDEDDWPRYGSAFDPVTNVVDVLDNFATQFPDWADQGFQIAGFGWFQGWNDGLSYTAGIAYRYKLNMAQFIRKLREYYVNRYPGKISPSAPFVVATAAFNGWDKSYPTRLAVADGQLAVGDPEEYPEFAGNVKSMEARNFWRDVSESPGSQGYHYNQNAETYMLVGDALGRGMIDLIDNLDTFGEWIARYTVGESDGFTQDPDFDGIPSGVENYFGTAPDTPSAGLVAGETGSRGFTFHHPLNSSPASDLTVKYLWSTDLENFHDAGASNGGGTTVNISQTTPSEGMATVTAEVTGTPVDKIFVAVEATQN